MNREQSIRQKITIAYEPSFLEIENESHKHSSGLGAESHFRVLVVSDQFAGASRVQRQRSVHELLQEELKAGLHALSLRLLTEDEWKTSTSEFESPLCASKKK